jgi:hypothetical protein
VEATDFKAVVAAAENDPASLVARENVCQTLGETFAAAGKRLWIVGYIIGPDRATGQSPKGFGSDATVGLATCLQIGGELTTGTAALLRANNLYARAALGRDLGESWVERVLQPPG